MDTTKLADIAKRDCSALTLIGHVFFTLSCIISTTFSAQHILVLRHVYGEEYIERIGSFKERCSRHLVGRGPQ